MDNACSGDLLDQIDHTLLKKGNKSETFSMKIEINMLDSKLLESNVLSGMNCLLSFVKCLCCHLPNRTTHIDILIFLKLAFSLQIKVQVSFKKSHKTNKRPCRYTDNGYSTVPATRMLEINRRDIQ